MVTENGMHDLKLPLLSIGVTLNHAFCYASCIHELFTTEMEFQGPYSRKKINKAYNIIGLLKRNFIHLDCYTFILLYKALVCPHLQHANSVWSPYKK